MVQRILIGADQQDILKHNNLSLNFLNVGFSVLGLREFDVMVVGMNIF